jgi:hypothetical protein
MNIKTVISSVETFIGKVVAFVESEAPAAEKVVNAFLPVLPAMEKELAAALAAAAEGQDVTAIEDMIALIIQIKNTAKAA